VTKIQRRDKREPSFIDTQQQHKTITPIVAFLIILIISINMRSVYPILKKVVLRTALIVFLLDLCQGSPSIHAPVSLVSRPKRDSNVLVASRCIRGGSTLATAINEGINPLVILSPVVTAAVCRDGIVLLAIHGPDVRDEDDDQHDDATATLKNLPVDCSGPFRIQSLDLQGNALLTAGWRADASYFTMKAQEIVKNERETVGSAIPARVLASQFSLLLATSAIGGNMRELNCVALLASNEGTLWLADPTGSYSVRALALGGGSLEVNGSLNDRLRQVDWNELSAEEGMARLLDLVSKQMKESHQNSLAVELAIVDLKNKRLVRKFLSDQK